MLFEINYTILGYISNDLFEKNRFNRHLLKKDKNSLSSFLD